ncbi:MAG: hypothetical protein JSV80_06420, partial [Acidobacteriota bacterium]
ARAPSEGVAENAAEPNGRLSAVVEPKLHELAIESFRIGNRGRLSLCDVLRVLADTRLFHELGHPSITAYAGAHFQLRRSETLESIRVTRALQELTRIREAFAEGRISFSSRSVARDRYPANFAVAVRGYAVRGAPLELAS